MKKIYFVSSNRGKIEEVEHHLKKFRIRVIGKVIELQEIDSESQEKVAREKAKYAAKRIGKTVITEDTGVYFKAYKNFPGAHPKFVFRSLGYGGILKLLENKNRKAYFKTTVAYCKPKCKPKTFIGVCKGRITKKVIGKSHPRLPYDSIFIPEGEKRTFSKMSKEEKGRYSHRAKALNKFARWFKKSSS